MKKVKYIVLSLLLLIPVMGLNAQVINKDDVPNSTYVIGTHMFTREVNEETGYNGVLTTQLIMLASKTIEGTSLEDMVIYYKNPRGNWVNAMSGDSVEVSSSIKVNYYNTALEEINDTVKAPKEPYYITYGPITYDQNDNTINYTLYVLIDDVDGDTVDGFVLYTGVGTNQAEFEDIQKSKFENSKLRLTDLSQFTKYSEGIVENYDYYYYAKNISFFCAVSSCDTYNINIRTYKLDANGNKLYSDIVLESILGNRQDISLESKFQSLQKIDSTNYHYYDFKISANGPLFNEKYLLESSNGHFELYYNEKNSNQPANKLIINSISDPITIAFEENKIYAVALRFFIDVDNYPMDFGYYSETIDTRKPTTPVLNVNGSYENGEYLSINTDFYSNQDKDSIDYSIHGAEMYRFYWENNKVVYELVGNKTYHTNVIPPFGRAYYTARVYAYDSEGEKIYSDFSDIITVVRTPEISVSNITNGKADLSIVNKDEFGSPVRFKVYTYDNYMNEVEIDDFAYSVDKITIDVSDGMVVFARAYDYDYYSNIEKVYSAQSNEVEIEL